MSAQERFHRFASRNFNRRCVFSSLLENNAAYCPHAVFVEKRPAAGARSASPQATQNSRSQSSKLNSPHLRVVTHTGKNNNSPEHTTGPRPPRSNCEFHCKSSTHQMDCVVSVDTAVSLCRFTLKQTRVDPKAIDEDIHGVSDKSVDQTLRLQVSAGLVNAMRETVLPHLHRRLPVTNLSKLVEQSFGPQPQSLKYKFTQSILRCVAQSRSETPSGD